MQPIRPYQHPALACCSNQGRSGFPTGAAERISLGAGLRESFLELQRGEREAESCSEQGLVLVVSPESLANCARRQTTLEF